MEEAKQNTANINMEITALPFVNYALQQSGKSFITSVTITAGEERENAELTVASTPEIFKELKVNIDYIPKGRALQLNNLKPDLKGEYLASLTEKEECRVIFTLASREGNILSKA